MKQASGFYSDSLEMLLDTMCNVLGMVIFITLTLAQLIQQAPATTPPSAAVLTSDLAAVTASNSVVETELQQIAQRLQQPHSFKTNLMSLPHENQTSRERWAIIVRYGRLFPLHLFGPGRFSAQPENHQSLAWEGRVVEPRWGQGDEPETGITDLIQRFRAASKTNICFDFFVFDDSFAAFNRAKETAVKLGFQYAWKPLPRDQKLRVDSRGGERLPAQN